MDAFLVSAMVFLFAAYDFLRRSLLARSRRTATVSSLAFSDTGGVPLSSALLPSLSASGCTAQRPRSKRSSPINSCDFSMRSIVIPEASESRAPESGSLHPAISSAFSSTSSPAEGF